MGGFHGKADGASGVAGHAVGGQGWTEVTDEWVVRSDTGTVEYDLFCAYFENGAIGLSRL